MGAPPSGGESPIATDFRALVEERFQTLHEVKEYARLLSITPGHLNHLAREEFGANAGSVIRDRITLEAKRLLLHSEARVSAIARDLGFSDPSYFSRFFRRETGWTPSDYRAQIHEKYQN